MPLPAVLMWIVLASHVEYSDCVVNHVTLYVQNLPSRLLAT